MNQGTRFAKRCLALLMAAILVATNFSGLAQFVRAEGNDGTSISIGEIVANNYDLTTAEKNLLSSGLLAGGTFEYTVPNDNDGLVTVDTENKTITATNKYGWVPTVAKIVVDGNVKETVTLTDGQGSYTFGENAFSVKVDYVLNTTVDTATQELLLGAPAALKAALDNMKSAYTGSDDKLGTVVMAMEVLRQLADGISLGWATAQFAEEAILAVGRLEQNIAANGGKLGMQVVNEAYSASASKVQFLMERGTEYKTAAVVAYQNLNAIKNDPLMNNALLDSYLKSEQPSDYTAWMALKGIINNTVAALEPAVNDDWSVLENNPLATGLTPAQYAQLDTLVAALGETTAMPEIKNELKVAETTLTVNMAMYNVTVVVELNTVKGLAGTKSVVLTLAEGASAAEIKAAIAASGIEAAAIASWGDAYVEGKFHATTSALPGSLNEDITYTISYEPNLYTVEMYDGSSQTVPYGTELVLPKHADPAQAYDYKVNGVSYVQGSKYIVVENATITRTQGKAYTNYDLYSVVADNYGNNVLQNILKSGALNGNVTISVRKPDPADAESLVTLVDGKLTAVATYDADYEGLCWVPYSYGENGNEHLFNGEYTVDWTGFNVKVQYRLVLENFNTATVKALLDAAVSLKEDAAAQKATLDSFAANHTTMGQLDKTKLGALNGVIGVTDFTPGDGTDSDAKNLELRAYFSNVVGSIINKNVDSNNMLKIYNMLTEYKAGGLSYYYANSAAVIAEINSLSAYLNQLLDEEEALKIMVTAAGFPEYAEKIADLGGKMDAVKNALSAPNAMIDLNSANLYKLIAALEADGEATYTAPASPYLTSESLTAVDDSKVMAQVIVNVNGVSAIFTTAEFDRGAVLPQSAVDQLIAQLNAFVANQLGANVAFYTVSGMDDLNALVGTVLNEKMATVYVAYEAKQYEVEIPGVGDVAVDVNNATITLPAHPVAGYVYHYNVGGQIITVGQEARVIVLNMSNLGDEKLVITREEFNQAAADTTATLEQFRDALNSAIRPGAATLIKNGDTYTGLVLNIGAADFMPFVMAMVNFSGYTYYGLNNEGLLYLNEEMTLEISVQTLINALFSDNGFGSDRLIALGNNGKGTLLETTLQLGNSADVLDANLAFAINFNSVPSQMSSVAGLLSQLKPYLSFNANNGALDIKMNLPDQVYGAYLAALLTTGYADKNDMNAVDQEIAFKFLCDYLDAFIDCGADLETIENTIAMLGKNVNLSQYNGYFTAALEYLTYSADSNGLNVNISVPGKSVVDKLLGMLGMGGDELSTFMGMIKEYKANGEIEVNAHGLLMNTEKNYNALILDAQAAGIANKFACTTAANLKNVVSNLAGASVIILLDDVDGDLHIAGTTILDLNGKNVSGKIYAEGTLYIMDSNMDTYGAGYVGAVSGKATIIDGNYGADVTAFLKDGYYMDGTTVRNNLYHIVADEKGNVTFVINTDVIDEQLPDVRALALDMVSDLILNYFTTAAMTVNGNEVYDVAFDELITLLASSSKVDDIIAKVLNTVSAAGISGLTNTIIADLLDFEGLYDALNSDGVVATYNMTVAPWMLGIGVTAQDCLDVSILSNGAKEESFNVSLKLEGSNTEYLKKLVKELGNIVEDDTKVEIDIQQPTYNDHEFGIDVSGTAQIKLDFSANTDYAKILGVILAYGNTSKRAAVAKAINTNDMEELKAVVDNTTVAELIKALKAMSRNVSFESMAKTVGVTVNVASAARLEQTVHLVLCGMGKALTEMDVVGMDAKFGALYNEATGRYELSGDKIITGELNFRTYTALYNLTASDMLLTVKLFADLTHVHDYKAVVTAPTCTEQGYTTYTCECGDSYIADWVDELGHDYKAVVTAPTCTEQGYTTYTCECGDSYQDDFVAPGHTFSAWQQFAPTCTEAGYETRYCVNCGETEKVTTAPATGHSFGEWITPGYVDELPCGAVYTETRHCACGEFESREMVKEIIWGDVNHDGVIDAYDATLVLRYAVGKEIEGEFCEAAADLDGDGVIDAYDATLILRYSVGKIDKFPVEE